MPKYLIKSEISNCFDVGLITYVLANSFLFRLNPIERPHITKKPPRFSGEAFCIIKIKLLFYQFNSLFAI